MSHADSDEALKAGFHTERDEAREAGLRTNKKGGTTVSVLKIGGWPKAWKLAKAVGRWK